MGYQSVVFEGGDQIGKGDAANIFSKKVMNEGITVKRIAFPMYSTPIGTVIRYFLKEDISEVKSLKKIVGTKRELEIRIMIYVLNRFEALESILRGSQKSGDLFLLDRSPYSNALTIAYGLGGLKNISKEDVKELVKLAFDADELFIESLNLKNCVICLKSDNGIDGWKSSRIEDTDLLESRDVQDVVDYIYEEFSNLVGEGWKEVLTRVDGKWRDREEIYFDIKSFVDLRISLERNSGNIAILDALEVAKDMYGVDITKLGNYEKYIKAICECDKESMYREALKIAKYITDNCKEVTISNDTILISMRGILDRYPEILDLFGHCLDKQFLKNFKTSIYEER